MVIAIDLPGDGCYLINREDCAEQQQQLQALQDDPGFIVGAVIMLLIVAWILLRKRK